jgi:hypothetical protein
VVWQILQIEEIKSVLQGVRLDTTGRLQARTTSQALWAWRGRLQVALVTVNKYVYV